MRKKSAKLKVLQGTFSKSREKEPVLFDESIPEPQRYLTEAGLDIYHRVALWCKTNKIITEIDSYNLSRLANALDIYLFHAEIVNKDPKRGIVRYKNGSNIDGHLIAMSRLDNLIDSIGRKYGLEQESREKLLAFGVKIEEEEEKDFIIK